MNRRNFLTSPRAVLAGKTEAIRNRGRRSADAVALGGSAFDPYTGPWGFDEAAHLLRRTLFGVRKEEITAAVSMSMNAAVDLLFEQTAAPTPPTGYKSSAEQPGWTSAGFDSTADPGYFTFLLSWWMDQMMTQGFSAREKMTLFWHNHFATGYGAVKDARFMYKQNALLREYAFGNFKDLVRRITFDPAMLVYLSGNLNKAGAPNENYGRELQELFTIGKGPERAQGDYTNYTETDIKMAARVLTGWSNGPKGDLLTPVFTPANHDSGDKTFTAAYGNRVIKGGNDEAGARREIDELLDMIFAQEATARYICRKVYRWFVDYIIDDQVENEIIAPMAAMLRQANFEVRTVVMALLKSTHFYTAGRIGCVIKTPVDLLVGTGRAFDWIGHDLDDATKYPYITLRSSDTRQRTWRYRTLRRLMAAMGMDLMNPPNVAGWPAYWQSPSYHELWVNADTLQKRINFLNDASATGLKFDESYGVGLIDVIGFVKGLATQNSANAVIEETARLLFPVALTDAQKTQLNDILLPGLPDYEWDVEWSDYLADSGNTTKQKAVEDKLRALFKFMLAMAEYQLS